MKKKINILMFLFFIFFFSGCAFDFIKLPSLRQKPVNQGKMQLSPKTTIIPEGVIVQKNITLSKNIPFVELYINGKGPFQFCIDTGVSSLLVSSELVGKLGLMRSSKNIEVILHTGTGKMNLGRPLEVEKISIGEAEFFEIDAAKINSNVLRELDFDGVLSLGVFKDCLFELDYINKHLKIYDPSVIKENISKNTMPAFFKDGSIYFQGKFGDNILNFQLDTGNSFGISISKPHQQNLKLKELKKKIKMVTFKYTQDVSVHTFEGDAVFGNIVFQNPDIYVHSKNLFGGEALKDCILRINQRAGYVEIEQKQ